MAAASTRSGNMGIFWMNGVSDEEKPLVFVPGLDGEAKTRTPYTLGSGGTGASGKGHVKVRARRTSDKNEPALKKCGKKQGHSQSELSGVYAKENVSVHHITTAATEQPTLSSASGAFHSSTQMISDTSRAKSLVCLKDLCPEDKRRIANLIEELARVSEEKEESVQRLKDEQENFERKIQRLEEQNLLIAQERESLQRQYRECQELLGLYQQYLSQQQTRLNQSIAQLSQEPAHSKVVSSEEAPSRASTSRANGSAFDGSYLSLAADRARQPQAHRCGGGKAPARNSRGSASFSCGRESSPAGGPIGRSRSQRQDGGELNSESRRRCERCPGCGQDSGYGTQQWRSEVASRLENGHHDTCDRHECERQSSHSVDDPGSDAKEALTRPLLGHEDWEEKRHQLLLQKMQLETERERLQARLVEQEERLSRQNQQLRQSRLDYSRFQQAARSDLSSSNTRNGDSPPEGHCHHHDLPCSACQAVEGLSAKQKSEKHSQTASAPLDNGNAEAFERSRKDTATSPPSSPASLSKPTSAPVIPRTPQDSADFSMVELLDIFTPLPAPELSEPSTRRPQTSQRRPTLAGPKPAGRTPLAPGGGPLYRHTRHDLEESQILEDIFFIC